jgi:transcriptional repressor NrdR
MRCPFCGASEDKVMETRVSRDGSEIRRRRECEGCARRYTTYERIEESMPLVVKNDGRREPFDRAKIAELGVSEIASRDVGERVLPRLRALDQVAYVRFASIYRDFRDLEGFEKELDALRNDTGPHPLSDEHTDKHVAIDPAERTG